MRKTRPCLSLLGTVKHLILLPWRHQLRQFFVLLIFYSLFFFRSRNCDVPNLAQCRRDFDRRRSYLPLNGTFVQFQAIFEEIWRQEERTIDHGKALERPDPRKLYLPWILASRTRRFQSRRFDEKARTWHEQQLT